MTSKFDFFSLELNTDKRFSTIKRVPGVPYSYMLREGNILKKEDFPKDLVFPVAEESGDIIGDSLDNIFSCFFISEKLMIFLSAISGIEKVIQFLPFNIKNKEGVITPENYYLANVTVSVDCFDREKGKHKLHPKTGKVWRIRTVEVEHHNIPENLKIFRLGEDKSRIIFRSDLVDAIIKNGFSGLSVFAMGATLP